MAIGMLVVVCADRSHDRPVTLGESMPVAVSDGITASVVENCTGRATLAAQSVVWHCPKCGRRAPVRHADWRRLCESYRAAGHRRVDISRIP